jgi:hypothetical protein
VYRYQVHRVTKLPAPVRVIPAEGAGCQSFGSAQLRDVTATDETDKPIVARYRAPRFDKIICPFTVSVWMLKQRLQSS